MSSYLGTVKAGLSPRKTFDTVDDITDANIIIAVVNGGEFSALSGLSTVSMAKKQPATAALNPENSKINHRFNFSRNEDMHTPVSINK